MRQTTMLVLTAVMLWVSVLTQASLAGPPATRPDKTMPMSGNGFRVVGDRDPFDVLAERFDQLYREDQKLRATLSQKEAIILKQASIIVELRQDAVAAQAAAVANHAARGGPPNMPSLPDVSQATPVDRKEQEAAQQQRRDQQQREYDAQQRARLVLAVEYAEQQYEQARRLCGSRPREAELAEVTSTRMSFDLRRRELLEFDERQTSH